MCVGFPPVTGGVPPPLQPPPLQPPPLLPPHPGGGAAAAAAAAAGGADALKRLRQELMQQKDGRAAARAAFTAADPALRKKMVREAAGTRWVDPTLAEWPENDFRIFVGDLGNEVSDDLLSKAFCRYPSFAKARVRGACTRTCRPTGVYSCSAVGSGMAPCKAASWTGMLVSMGRLAA